MCFVKAVHSGVERSPRTAFLLRRLPAQHGNSRSALCRPPQDTVVGRVPNKRFLPAAVRSDDENVVIGRSFGLRAVVDNEFSVRRECCLLRPLLAQGPDAFHFPIRNGDADDYHDVCLGVNSGQSFRYAPGTREP